MGLFFVKMYVYVCVCVCVYFKSFVSTFSLSYLCYLCCNVFIGDLAGVSVIFNHQQILDTLTQQNDFNHKLNNIIVGVHVGTMLCR